jgi:hypothetical protein
LTLVALLAKTYSLRSTPLLGREQYFAFKLSVGSGSRIAEQEFRLKEKILKVEADGGYTSEITRTFNRLTLNGQDLERPTLAPVVARFDKRGNPIDRGEPQPMNPTVFTLVSVANFVPPPKPLPLGATYRGQIRFDARLQHTDANVAYKLAGLTSFGGEEAVKVTYTYREVENPVVFTGYFLFRTRDFTCVQLRGAGKNVVNADGLPTGTASVSMDLESETRGS